MAWMLTFTRVMSSKTVPEAWWCDVLCDWISNTTSDKRTSMKALASVHAVRYLSQRLLHFQGWQEKKWLTRSMNMLLKKCVTVARNLNIDSNSADLVSISFGVIKILQETCKPSLIFKCSKSVVLSLCTGTLTTNAKNSTLHSPVEYVTCCPTPPRLISQHT